MQNRCQMDGGKEKYDNGKLHRDSNCAVPEPEGTGLTECWWVEALPQKG